LCKLFTPIFPHISFSCLDPLKLNANSRQKKLIAIMPLAIASQTDDVALKRRMALAGSSGPMAAFHNMRVVGIAMFACLGGLLYGYNQGVFSGMFYTPMYMV
jgi:hypothetical protein